VVNCHPFDAERSAGRTYLQGCHKSSPSPKDGAPKGLERPGSGHVQGTHFYPKSNFRQVYIHVLKVNYIRAPFLRKSGLEKLQVRVV